MTDYSQFMPGALASLAARTTTRFGLASRFNPLANTIVTNIPGPREPLFLAGACMLTILGTAPVVDGTGLLNDITSYRDDFAIAFMSCDTMMPDPQFYAECIDASFDALAAATTSSQA